MFCTHCGHEVSDCAKFCGFCGWELSAAAETLSTSKISTDTVSFYDKKKTIFVLGGIILFFIFLGAVFSGSNADAPDTSIQSLNEEQKQIMEYLCSNSSEWTANFPDGSEVNRIAVNYRTNELYIYAAHLYYSSSQHTENTSLGDITTTPVISRCYRVSENNLIGFHDSGPLSISPLLMVLIGITAGLMKKKELLLKKPL